MKWDIFKFFYPEYKKKRRGGEPRRLAEAVSPGVYSAYV